MAKVFLLIVFSLAFAAVPGADGWEGAGSVGSWLAASHKLLSATTWFEKAVARPGGDPAARARLGNALLRRGQSDKAAAALKLATVGGASAPSAWKDLASAEKAMGDLPGSLRTLRADLSMHPNDVEAWTRLVRDSAGSGLGSAEIRQRLGTLPVPSAAGAAAQEVAYLQAACIVGPETSAGSAGLDRAAAGPDQHLATAARDLLDATRTASAAAMPLAIANSLLDQGLTGPAMEYLQKEQQGPMEAQRLALLGYALAGTGRNDEAAQLLNRALTLDPNLASAQMVLGDVLRAQGKPDEAIPWLEKAAKANSNDAGAYVELANALVDIGDYGTAEQALKLATQADPENGELHLAVASFYVSRQYRVEKAVPEAEDAVRLLGSTSATLGTLGWGLHLAGRSKDALGPIREAVMLDPESALLRYRLGSVYEGLGQKEDARQQYLMVQELDGVGAVWSRAQAALDGL